MKIKKKSIRLPLRFELAYEIIYKAISFILFGFIFLFASNLLRFNWFSVFFGILLLLLIYLRRSSYLVVEDGRLSFIYFKFFKGKETDLKDIDAFFFYENHSLIEIKLKNHQQLNFYLNERNKEQLLNWLLTHYPEIAPHYIKHI